MKTESPSPFKWTHIGRRLSQSRINKHLTRYCSLQFFHLKTPALKPSHLPKLSTAPANHSPERVEELGVRATLALGKSWGSR